MGVTLNSSNVSGWASEIERFYDVSDADMAVIMQAAEEIPGYASMVEHILDDAYFASDSEYTNTYNNLANTDAEKEIALQMLAQDARDWLRGRNA